MYITSSNAPAYSPPGANATVHFLLTYRLAMLHCYCHLANYV